MYPKYELYSTIPIVECTGYIDYQPATRERELIHICQTEALYAHMTGKKIAIVKLTGAYRL
jgi:hypothetical protein